MNKELNILSEVRRAFVAWLPVVLMLGILSSWAGCSLEPRKVADSNSKNKSSSQNKNKSAIQTKSTDGSKIASPRVSDKHKPKNAWNTLVEQMQDQLHRDAVDEARKSLADLEQIDFEPSAKQQAELASLTTELEEKLKAQFKHRAARKTQLTKTHKESLARANELVDQGQLQQADSELDRVLNSEPAEAQRQQAMRLKGLIEASRRQMDQLKTAMDLLSSKKREDVLSAQNLLFEHSDAALGLLRKAVRDNDSIRVGNALEILRLLKRPKETLPIMLDVLERIDQQPNWPSAIRQIQLTDSAGAGEPLLRLALATDLFEQRVAALTCLSGVVDPPRRTVLSLMPMIQTDGPELAAVLMATLQAILVHHQHDLWTGRGLDRELSPEQMQKIRVMPERLKQIMAANSDSSVNKKAIVAARALCIATRLIAPEAIAKVKLLAFSGETSDARAAAVVDDQFNTVEPTKMWRHPVKSPGSLVLDLGSEKTVVGVRIWNYNQKNATQFGWKDVNIFVGSHPESLLDPVTQGMVPQAPGVINGHDYSTIVPVNFIRGRYLRLEATSYWKQEKYAGLTEVQVLGF